MLPHTVNMGDASTIITTMEIREMSMCLEGYPKAKLIM